MMNEMCAHIKCNCIHPGTKCSECPITELICDEFYNCIDNTFKYAFETAVNKYHKTVENNLNIDNLDVFTNGEIRKLILREAEE